MVDVGLVQSFQKLDNKKKTIIKMYIRTKNVFRNMTPWERALALGVPSELPLKVQLRINGVIHSSKVKTQLKVSTFFQKYVKQI